VLFPLSSQHPLATMPPALLRLTEDLYGALCLDLQFRAPFPKSKNVVGFKDMISVVGVKPIYLWFSNMPREETSLSNQTFI
jgi:hypothetical protein